MHGSLINEHNISLGLISLAVLFSRLSGMEKCIVIRIVDKYSLTTIVSDKYQAKRQDTKSIDKRSYFQTPK